MGGGDIFRLCDKCSRHKQVDFPGHKHASLFDISKIAGEITMFLEKMGIRIFFRERITKLEKKDNTILSIQSEGGTLFNGEVFIDTTGTAGPLKNCKRYGNGCAMCILRCPSFGSRISLTGLAGVKEMTGWRENGILGSMSGSCKLNKDSLGDLLVQELEEKGCYACPVPVELREDHRKKKSCQQYAAKEYVEHIVLLDTGHAKMMTSYFPLKKLRELPGFEYARYEDPYAGGIGNSMRFFDMAPRDNYMQVEGMDNLFCAGEKAGLLVGHTEAIVTGVLAGYNSVRKADGKKLLELSRETAVGEGIAFAGEGMKTEEGRKKRYTFSGSVLWENMKECGLYEANVQKIAIRVRGLGLENIFEI